MTIDIRPLTPDLQDAYLFLFDHIVHKENPDWSKCYCNDYHFLGDVESCTRENSRNLIIDRIQRHELQGYLVFEGDKPIGWCNVNNRENYQRLLRDYDLIDNPEDTACSIVCFLIHPDHRRKGISQKLLERIISDASDSGYDYIESYPKKGDPSASHFNGPLALYHRNGFTIWREYDTYSVLRKTLP